MSSYIKGRGAQINPENKFLQHSSEKYYDDLPTQEEREEHATHNPKTTFIEVFPKTIINKKSDESDVPFSYSMNPYQGCEHGCIYCYARNTHEYWGFSAGRDFEEKILVKKNAPTLLEEAFNKKSWKVSPIMLSGNTDCYQPIERKLQITRKMLEVCARYKHPVSIITKNTLIDRDVDILAELAKENLVVATLSLTTLNEELKRVMEPRTASVRNVLRTIKSLSEAGVPVNVNAAPMIPSLNDHEMYNIIKAASEHGASSIHYTVVRLNGQLGEIFTDWVTKNFPDRAPKILNHIKSMHNGQLNDSRKGIHTEGEGEWADFIKQQYTLAVQKFLGDKKIPKLNCELFYQYRDKQLKLF